MNADLHSPKSTKFELVDLQCSVSGLHALGVYFGCVCFRYTYIYIYFFRFFSIIGYYKMLSIVPCVVQKDLVSNLFYIQ